MNSNKTIFPQIHVVFILSDFRYGKGFGLFPEDSIFFVPNSVFGIPFYSLLLVLGEYITASNFDNYSDKSLFRNQENECSYPMFNFVEINFSVVFISYSNILISSLVNRKHIKEISLIIDINNTVFQSRYAK